MPLEVVPFDERWRAEAEVLWTREMASPRVASRGRLHYPSTLPGFVALHEGRFAGVVTYVPEDRNGWEVLTVHSAIEALGAASSLLEAVAERARAERVGRLWLITTNDNTPALRFYQRRGWRLAAIYPGAVEESRRTLKPEIPPTGEDGIPIRDEIELELPL